LAHLWLKESANHAQGPLIHLSDIDLSDDDIRGEALKVAGNAWEAVIGTDIAAWEGSDRSGSLESRFHRGLTANEADYMNGIS